MHYLTIPLLLLFAITIKANSNCSQVTGRFLYDEIKCKPNLDKNGCPESYNCSDYHIPKDGCLFEGHVYKDGQILNGTRPCRQCTCNIKNNTSSVSCYKPCQFRGGIGPVIPRGCYAGHILNSCCRKIECPTASTPVCVSNDRTYYPGQYFQPCRTCMDCVCQQGFQGELVEPFCRKMRCDVEILYSKQIVDNCAPLYCRHSPLCCPKDFICPSSCRVENIIRSNKTSNEEKCKFGTQSFSVGDTLDLLDLNANSSRLIAYCACTLPPLLTCFD
ncbi:PREDICTED: kielin/chordin-like protein [Nicrophorus vespilloides]|uniref:Kielin/chordin-like protein n=1 Tax=Nicrophorus vespilloides TaxID=110193 RepID=A0ABM1MET7_NICVS|nr:PREDICTED: kielin/chordin-like protein [Nicrophorus vespilloides]